MATAQSKLTEEILQKLDRVFELNDQVKTAFISAIQEAMRDFHISEEAPSTKSGLLSLQKKSAPENKKKKKQNRKPTKTGYQLYVSARMSAMKESGSEVPPKERMGFIAKQWGTLGDEDKETYKRRADIFNQKVAELTAEEGWDKKTVVTEAKAFLAASE